MSGQGNHTPRSIQVLQEVSHAVRSFRRTPALSLAAATILVLGVGLNTAVFTFVNAAMIRAFPYPNPERVGAVFEAKEGRTTTPGWPLTAANLADLRAQVRSFEVISASTPFSVELAGDEPVRLAADRVLSGDLK